MANYYMRTSIIRAASGKSAIASAAYQAGQALHSTRLDQTFPYSNKEEVVHAEILLPDNAPREYFDRETLWNAVEEVQNKANSRYARQFIIAVPNEWSRKDAIDRSREFIQKAFVDRGMAVDWAYHEKNGKSPADPDNHHLHVMCTIRGFKPDGSWASMEKKEYALDEKGERIPEIDQKTGEQKVRERTRDGYHSVEKIWKRITVQVNTWNTRQQLMSWRKEWADHCNRYLDEQNQIDHRSYEERGIYHVPVLHEGSAVREMEKRGIHTDISEENKERRELNNFFQNAAQFIQEAWQKLESFVDSIKERRCRHDNIGSKAKEGSDPEYAGTDRGISVSPAGHTGRDAASRHDDASFPKQDTGTEDDDNGVEQACGRVSGIRKKLRLFAERSRALANSIGSATRREQESQSLAERVRQIQELNEQLTEQTAADGWVRRRRVHR